MSQKEFLQSAYRFAIGGMTLVASPFRGNDTTAVFYGGARAGDLGGPLVKIKLLQQKFPQAFPGYSLIYLLSNAIYLPQFVIDRAIEAGIPVVLNQNGVFYKGWFPDGWEQKNERMSRLHAAASHVFYQSEFCRTCAHKFLGPRSGNSEILYNGVDTDHFTPAKQRASKGTFTFLVTGRISASTAHRLKSSVAGLAAARKGGMDCALKVAGEVDDTVLADVKIEIARVGVADHVVFTGEYRHADAPALYRSADAYLMTKHNDPCPNTVLEALAAGLPVVYSASGGVPELVGNDAGVGVSVQQSFEVSAVPKPYDIAKGMEVVIKERELMAVNARKRAVERFSLANWYAKHGSVFNNLLDRSM